MKSLVLGFLMLYSISFTDWKHDLVEAKLTAQKEHKFILLNFSGSDWCGPCIRLHKEILEVPEFVRFADRNLVMVNADFPRLRKNQLPPEQQKINEEMAEQYNPKGIFPFTLLLDEHGKVLKTWEGKPNIGPDDFIGDIQLAIVTK